MGVDSCVQLAYPSRHMDVSDNLERVMDGVGRCSHVLGGYDGRASQVDNMGQWMNTSCLANHPGGGRQAFSTQLDRQQMANFLGYNGGGPAQWTRRGIWAERR